MTSIGSEPVRVTPATATTSSTNAKATDEAVANSAVKVEQNKVTLSAEGKALLAALQQIEKEGVAVGDKSVGDKVESFAHGALGMDHPDKFKEEDDTSYSAGQYLSAAATLGGIIALLI
ncbi:conserved hypothetical protein [Vibrio nigripulchritudo MADA3029]|uniref:Uncharacterized protein n=2 Tax=Vibrio nigripulchritudo TaxID=28173 RepID=U4K2W5_9VIBR|nr:MULTISPECIES: hypothetical protein [Vibrio]EGU56016.1 hypothetical protein VINI7043_10906 [Vibrio nigripulchritudo ATCC 27043]KJY72678.1 hypothetical protein TW74_21315 [Vibrio nigripulchritudo]UAB71347.1 hypothetical protein INR79_05420 [Vibrio sp. SCSIO 43132]CCN32991.1 conserved hypothetical protein [Vibrio nigripulchritudo AM115]CCN42801.1 conserved hypothetical protein [Vibrio nigripulchritudo FTn2]